MLVYTSSPYPALCLVPFPTAKGYTHQTFSQVLTLLILACNEYKKSLMTIY